MNRCGCHRQIRCVTWRSCLWQLANLANLANHPGNNLIWTHPHRNCGPMKFVRSFIGSKGWRHVQAQVLHEAQECYANFPPAFLAQFSIITSAANLGFTYYCQKRWEEAEKLVIWVVQERTKSPLVNFIGQLYWLAKKQLAETDRQQGKEGHTRMLEGKVGILFRNS